jgi:S1-C subfamily serine protease
MTTTNEIEELYAKAVEKAGASVVNIRTEAASGGHCCAPFLQGCTGVVLDAQGHILVALDGLCDADRLTVTMNNGHMFAATLVGEDPQTNTAVIKIDPEECVPADLGDSDHLRLGQPIFAMGNSLGIPGGLTATSGIISALPRGLVAGLGGAAVLVTDATINPANGGGILADLEGRVIGVNTSRMPHSGGMGIAFPINRTKALAEEIIRHGKVDRSWLGVTAYDVTPRLAYQFQLPDTNGVFVAEAVPGGPAEGAGLRMGDVLLSLNETKVNNVVDLLSALQGMRSGQAIDANVRRNGRAEVIHVTLGARPN